MHLVSKLNKKIVFNHRAVFSCTKAEYQPDYTDPKIYFDYSTFGIPQFTRYHIIRFPLNDSIANIDFWTIVQKLLIMTIKNSKVIIDAYLPYIYEGKNYEGRYIIRCGQLLGVRLNTMVSSRLKKYSRWPRKKIIYQKFQHSDNIFLQNRRNDYVIGEFSLKMLNLRMGLVFKDEVEYCIYEYSLYEYEVIIGEVDRGFSHFVVDPSDACFKMMKKCFKKEPIDIQLENVTQIHQKKIVLRYHLDFKNNRLFHKYTPPNFSQKELIHQLEISSIMNSKISKKISQQILTFGQFQLISLFYQGFNEQHHNTLEFLKIVEQIQNKQKMQIQAKRQRKRLEKLNRQMEINKDANYDNDDSQVLITDGNQLNPAYVHRQALEIIDKTRKFLKVGLKCHKCQIVYDKKAMCVCEVKQCQNTFCKKCLIEEYQWNILTPQANKQFTKSSNPKRNPKKILTFASDGLDYINNCPICYQKCDCQLCKEYQKKLTNLPMSSNKQKILCHYCKQVSIIAIECWNQECKKSFCYTCCSEIFQQPQVGKAINKEWICYVCREKCPCSDCIKRQKLKLRQSETGLQLLGGLTEAQKKFLEFLREGKDPQNDTKQNHKNSVKKQPEVKKQYEKRPWENKKSNNTAYTYQPRNQKKKNQENHYYTKKQVKVQKDIEIKEKFDTNENEAKGLWGKKNGMKNNKQHNKNKETLVHNDKQNSKEESTSALSYIIPAENQLMNNFSNDFEY